MQQGKEQICQYPTMYVNTRYNDTILMHVSGDSTRVRLAPIAGIDGSDYINANFIDVCWVVVGFSFVCVCFVWA